MLNISDQRLCYCRLSGQNESAQMAFMQRWMQSHSIDSKGILKKPLVMAEFGKSSKDQGCSLGARDQYLSTVYQSMNNFESTGGGISGSLVWQLMAEGMDSYGDGYGIILSQDASTRGVISAQSHKMTTFRHMLLGRKHGKSVPWRPGLISTMVFFFRHGLLNGWIFKSIIIWVIFFTFDLSNKVWSIVSIELVKWVEVRTSWS